MKRSKTSSKKIVVWAAAMLCALSLTACQQTGTQNSVSGSEPLEEITSTDIPLTTDAQQQETENTNMQNLEIIVAGQSFSAQLYDTEAAKVFAAMLPLTVEMQELNGNEKYYYLPDTLPTDAGNPDWIHTGDLMLYGSDCLVLFYEDFPTSYSYTPLGRITDTGNLENAVGTGDVTVTFQFTNSTSN